MQDFEDIDEDDGTSTLGYVLGIALLAAFMIGLLTVFWLVCFFMSTINMR